MHKYNPADGSPYFSDDARIEIKTRDGRVQTCYSEPWTLVGWHHTNSRNDIMEFRVLRGSVTMPKKVGTATRLLAPIEDDARRFTGTHPYRGFGNLEAGDVYFDQRCIGKYGEEAWRRACVDVMERRHLIEADALSIEQINEIAARRGLPVRRA